MIDAHSRILFDLKEDSYATMTLGLEDMVLCETSQAQKG